MKISIPEEFRAEIIALSEAQDRCIVNVAINTEAFKQALKKLDADEAYRLKIKEKGLSREQSAAHTALWAGIKKALPATSEDNWSLDPSDLTVSPSSGGGMSSLFGR